MKEKVHPGIVGAILTVMFLLIGFALYKVWNGGTSGIDYKPGVEAKRINAPKPSEPRDRDEE